MRLERFGGQQRADVRFGPRQMVCGEQGGYQQAHEAVNDGTGSG